MKEVTVIIVAYKSSHIICDALKNIVNKGYKIVIVDNASNDDLRELLHAKFPDSGIELVLLENNCGFGKANNLALDNVDTDFALLLNPDAIISPESIDNLVKCAKKDRKIAMAGAIDIKSEDPTGERKEKALKNYHRLFKVREENDDFMSVNFLCGGYVLLKMSVFKKIGFFDENLFLYGEDDEICHRSIKNGYKNVLVKDAFSFHKDHTSTKTNSNFEKICLFYKRNWHMGWSKTYLKRKNKNYLIILAKSLIQFFLAFPYLIKPDLKRVLARLGRSTGSLSNLIGIDCFNKHNRVPKIKEKYEI